LDDVKITATENVQIGVANPDLLRIDFSFFEFIQFPCCICLLLTAATWKIKLVARVCGMLIMEYSFLRKNEVSGIVDDRSLRTCMK